MKKALDACLFVCLSVYLFAVQEAPLHKYKLKRTDLKKNFKKKRERKRQFETKAMASRARIEEEKLNNKLEKNK